MSHILDELKEINKEGKLVPFIGSELSEPFNIPNLADLIKEYANSVDLGAKPDTIRAMIEIELSKHLYWRALDDIKVHGIKKDKDIQEFVKKKFEDILKDYKDIKDYTDNNYKDIIGLNSKLFLTTNYDDILERTMQNDCYKYNLRSFDNNTHELFKADRRTVFHFHGIYNEVSSIAITEETYKDLYNEEKYKNLFSLLAGGYTFLFVGFSFNDIFVRNILKDINKYFNNKHYILLNNPNIEKTEELKMQYNIETIPYDSAKTSHVNEIREIITFLRQDISKSEEMGGCNTKNNKSIEINYNANFTEIFEVIRPEEYNEQHLKNNDIHRFAYKSRLAKFCGREDEINQLNKFRDDDKKFLWWAITGHAGSGKSRLALEFALEQHSSWLCCYLKHGDINEKILEGSNLPQIIKERNMLIIVDYVIGREMFVGKLIEKLSYLSHSSNFKIRVLLLEREKPADEENALSGNWYSLLSNENRNNYEFLSRHKYSGEFLDLKPLGEKNQLNIAQSTLKELGINYISKDLEGIQKKLREIDKGLCRPLYLQIIAEAWKSENINSKEGLLKPIIQKERNRWNNILISGMKKADRKITKLNLKKIIQLMIFVNAVGKVEIENNSNLPKRISDIWDSIKQIFTENKFGDFEEMDVVKNLIKKLNDNNKCEDGFIYAIQPDIIKEYMVLYLLESDTIESFLEDTLCFNLLEFSRFLYMSIQDFPSHSSLDKILKKIPSILSRVADNVPQNENSALEFSKGLINLTEVFGKKEYVTGVNVTLSELKQLKEEYQKNEEIALRYACGLIILPAYYGEEKAEESRDLVEKVKQLKEEYPKNEEIALWYARGLSFLIIKYRKEKLEESSVFVEQLKQLKEEYPKNEEIALWYARCLNNLVFDYRKDKVEGISVLVEQLKQLKEEYPKNEEIALQYGISLNNLVFDYGKDKVEEISALVEQLKQLKEEYPENEEIALQYASCLVILIAYYEKDKVEESSIFVKQLKHLKEENPKNEEIVLDYARGLAHYYVKEKVEESSSVSLEHLKHLKEEYPKNEEIALLYAKCFNNLVLNCVKEKEESSSVSLEHLKHLKEEYPENEEIALEYASGLCVLIAYYGKDKVEEISVLVEQLKQLKEEYPKNEEIALQYANGLIFLTAYYGKDKVEERITLVEQLKQLKEEYLKNEEIALQYARGLNNLAFNYEKEKVEEKNVLVEKMKLLKKEYPKNEKIALQYARGRKNLQNNS